MFDMVDGQIGTVNILQQSGFVSNALTLGGATINLELNNTAADQLVVTGAASVSGTNTINITPLGITLAAGTYPLITAASGIGPNFQFSNSSTSESLTVNGTVYSLNLQNSSTVESLVVALPSLLDLDRPNRRQWHGRCGLEHHLDQLGRRIVFHQLYRWHNRRELRRHQSRERQQRHHHDHDQHSVRRSFAHRRQFQ